MVVLCVDRSMQLQRMHGCRYLVSCWTSIKRMSNVCLRLQLLETLQVKDVAKDASSMTGRAEHKAPNHELNIVHDLTLVCNAQPDSGLCSGRCHLENCTAKIRFQASAPP